MFKFIHTKPLIFVLIVLCPILAALLMALFPTVIQRQEMAVFDLYQTLISPPSINQKFVVILARDRSITEIGAWPWPRRNHAKVIEQLSQAKLVVFDILFPEPSSLADDNTLAQAVQNNGRVISACSILPNRTGNSQDIVLPYRAMASAALDFGMANVEPDSDGVTRDYQLLWEVSVGSISPSLPLVIYQNLGLDLNLTSQKGRAILNLPGGEVPLEPNYKFKIYNPAPDPPTYEYVDVLMGLVPPEAFKDAVVVIGVDAAGASDALSVGLGRMIPGSIFVVNATKTLIHGWIPTQASSIFSILVGALMALTGALIGLLNTKAGRGHFFSHGLLWLTALTALWLGLDYFSFNSFRTWLPPLLPLILSFGSFGLVSLIETRLMAADWRIQKMSIDSVLMLGSQDLTNITISFPEYLRERWPEIERWTGVSLLFASLPANSEEIKHIIKQLPEGEKNTGAAMEVSILTSKHGLNRVFLGLPDLESRVNQYTVLGWTGRLSPDTIKSLSALILSVAMHFKAVEEFRARQKLFIGVISIIMEAVDAKDPYTAGHSNRVASLAKELAQKLALPQVDVDNIFLGGLLHDVGKLGVPDNILNKPGKLDDTEMNVMRSHPTIGRELMNKIELPKIIMQAISEHHERPDGQGYPNHLYKTELSMAGRILKVADVYDALISKRQYKEPFPIEKAYAILNEGRGKEYDEFLIDLILKKPFSQDNEQNNE